MRIGIDIDDTIAKTSILYSQKKELYLKNHSLKMSQLVGTYHQDFLNTYLETVFLEEEVMEDASFVIQKWIEEGHDLFLITARNNTYVDTIKDVLDVSKKWLLKNQIPIDQIYIDK